MRDRFVVPEDIQPSMKGHWADAFAEADEGLAYSPAPAGGQDLRSEPDAPAGGQDLRSVPDAPAGGQDSAAPKTALSRRPLHIEIGMGKGKFLTALAERSRGINYLGIEKYSSVLVRAVRKREALEEAGNHMDNLLYLRMDAEKLTDIFAPGEVDRIYLNFSDPWPKDRHAHRRLPGRTFLARYRQILSDSGHIEFKTDNRPLFDFAVEEAKAAGWAIDACTCDLHADPVLNEGNIMTEYEERFSALGNPICKLISRPPRQ